MRGRGCTRCGVLFICVVFIGVLFIGSVGSESGRQVLTRAVKYAPIQIVEVEKLTEGAAHIVMAYIVLACIVMAHIVVAYMVMAC